MVSPVCGKVNDSFPYDGYIYMKKALAVASAFFWQGHKDLNYPTLVFSLTIVNHTVPKLGVFRTNNGVF